MSVIFKAMPSLTDAQLAELVKFNNNQCSICRNDFKVGDSISYHSIQDRTAKHAFHERDLRRWLNLHPSSPTCPNCRAPVAISTTPPRNTYRYSVTPNPRGTHSLGTSTNFGRPLTPRRSITSFLPSFESFAYAFQVAAIVISIVEIFLYCTAPLLMVTMPFSFALAHLHYFAGKFSGNMLKELPVMAVYISIMVVNLLDACSPLQSFVNMGVYSLSMALYAL